MMRLSQRHESAIDELRRAVELTPPGGRVQVRIDTGLAIVDAGETVAARRWFHALFTDSTAKPTTVLAALHEAAPTGLELTPLIPDGAKDLLEEYAAILLREGSLGRRERVLDAALLRPADSSRLTVRDAVTLIERSVERSLEKVRDNDQAAVLVRLTLAIDEGRKLDGQLMCLSALSSRCRFDTYFKPAIGSTVHTRYRFLGTQLRAATRWPLQPYSGGIRFPVGRFEVDDEILYLTPGRSIRAENALYRTEVRPSPRDRDRIGLRVREGTTLFKNIRIGAGATELALTTEGDRALLVRFNGIVLGPARSHRQPNRQPSRPYRTPLPDSVGGDTRSLVDRKRRQRRGIGPSADPPRTGDPVIEGSSSRTGPT